MNRRSGRRGTRCRRSYRRARRSDALAIQIPSVCDARSNARSKLMRLWSTVDRLVVAVGGDQRFAHARNLERLCRLQRKSGLGAEQQVGATWYPPGSQAPAALLVRRRVREGTDRCYARWKAGDM